MHEVVLEPVGGDERLVTLGQRPLETDAIADIAKRHERAAVGQWNRGAVEDAAVREFEPELGERRPFESGDRELNGAPRIARWNARNIIFSIAVPKLRSAPLRDFFDMGIFRDRRRRKLP